MFQSDEIIGAQKIKSAIIPFGKASGSANQYTVTIPNVEEYVEGLTICVQISATNTGRSTINVNGLGNVEIKDIYGNYLTNGFILQDIPYQMYFDNTNFILLDRGNFSMTTSDDILQNKSAAINGQLVVGTMPNIGTVNYNLPLNGNYVIPRGYHSGQGKVSQNVPSYNANTNAVSLAGNSDLQVRIPNGAYLNNTGSGYPEINIPADWIRNNLGISANKIVEGQSIGGINGNRNIENMGGRMTFYCENTNLETITEKIKTSNTTSSYEYLLKLSFEPRSIIIIGNENSSFSGYWHKDAELVYYNSGDIYEYMAKNPSGAIWYDYNDKCVHITDSTAFGSISTKSCTITITN